MGEGGFLEKLKAMFGGGAPAPAPTPEPRVPWETPMGPSGGPPPIHMMPSGEMMAGPPMSPQPSPSPGPQDAIGAQVQALMKQREIMKLLSPEQAWNTPQK